MHRYTDLQGYVMYTNLTPNWWECSMGKVSDSVDTFGLDVVWLASTLPLFL